MSLKSVTAYPSPDKYNIFDLNGIDKGSGGKVFDFKTPASVYDTHIVLKQHYSVNSKEPNDKRWNTMYDGFIHELYAACSLARTPFTLHALSIVYLLTTDTEPRTVLGTTYRKAGMNIHSWSHTKCRELDGKEIFCTLVKTAYTLLRSIEYLHKHDMIHNDISSGNIMVFKDYGFLIDFGLSYPKFMSQYTFQGTSTYRNSYFESNPSLHQERDVFSIAKVLGDVLKTIKNNHLSQFKSTADLQRFLRFKEMMERVQTSIQRNASTDLPNLYGQIRMLLPSEEWEYIDKRETIHRKETIRALEYYIRYPDVIQAVKQQHLQWYQEMEGLRLSGIREILHVVRKASIPMQTPSEFHGKPEHRFHFTWSRVLLILHIWNRFVYGLYTRSKILFTKWTNGEFGGKPNLKLFQVAVVMIAYILVEPNYFPYFQATHTLCREFNITQTTEQRGPYDLSSDPNASVQSRVQYAMYKIFQLCTGFPTYRRVGFSFPAILLHDRWLNTKASTEYLPQLVQLQTRPMDQLCYVWGKFFQLEKQVLEEEQFSYDTKAREILQSTFKLYHAESTSFSKQKHNVVGDQPFQISRIDIDSWIQPGVMERETTSQAAQMDTKNEPDSDIDTRIDQRIHSKSSSQHVPQKRFQSIILPKSDSHTSPHDAPSRSSKEYNRISAVQGFLVRRPPNSRTIFPPKVPEYEQEAMNDGTDRRNEQIAKAQVNSVASRFPVPRVDTNSDTNPFDDQKDVLHATSTQSRVSTFPSSSQKPAQISGHSNVSFAKQKPKFVETKQQAPHRTETVHYPDLRDGEHPLSSSLSSKSSKNTMDVVDVVEVIDLTGEFDTSDTLHTFLKVRTPSERIYQSQPERPRAQPLHPTNTFNGGVAQAERPRPQPSLPTNPFHGATMQLERPRPQHSQPNTVRHPVTQSERPRAQLPWPLNPLNQPQPSNPFQQPQPDRLSVTRHKRRGHSDLSYDVEKKQRI